MKHLFHNQPASIGRLLLAASLMVLGGCAEWGSNPARMQADYGASVRKLVSNQIYNPSKARYPAALAPDGMEANKADSILNSTYRSGSTQSGSAQAPSQPPGMGMGDIIINPRGLLQPSMLGTPGAQ